MRPCRQDSAPMKHLLLQVLKRPRTCAAVLGGFLLCLNCVGVAWRVSDRALAEEAKRQALAGQSGAVAVMREDWATAVVPVALLTAGPPGKEARSATNARIDLAIRLAEKGNPRPLQRDAHRVLRALRTADGVPTHDGARWARWLAERLTATAVLFAPKEKLRLLTEADVTLGILAASAQRPAETIAVETAPPPTAFAYTATADTPPTPTAVVEPMRNPLVEPAPMDPGKSTPIERRQSASLSWQPGWQERIPPTTEFIEQEPLRKATSAVEPVRTIADRSERDLLGEFVELATRLPPQPRASGPTSTKPADVTSADEVARRQLEALRSELARRGFRSVTAEQVDALLSDDTDVRMALVHRLLSDPQSDGVRLLLLLASDESALVRAAAISGLGSSSSRSLVETAWELATQDADYRVGRLAEGLRQRLH